MKLVDALKLIQSPAGEGSRSYTTFLACGFTPLHLQKFLAAHLRLRSPEIRTEIRVGLFGDLAGNLERLTPSEVDSLAVAVEWSDLDARLGIRALGGWRAADLADIAGTAQAAVQRIQSSIEKAAREITVAVSLPTLPLPPAFTSRPTQQGLPEARLHCILAQFAEFLAGIANVRLLNPQHLATLSAPTDRYDIKSELATGFPYTLSHASALAESLSGLIESRSPMKALITDLDDTLWSGIVGEDGVEGISWNLDRHSQMHGVYQQFLASLAASGTLIGVASKNDASTVALAFEQRNLLLSKDDIFPFEVHWSAKSQSVARILNAWNIGAQAAVFIDDSQAELAEVQAAHPELICRLFPKNDPVAIWALLQDLRDLFGKTSISREDSLRLSSIMNSGEWRKNGATEESQSDDFLRSAQARIIFEYGRGIGDRRAFELVNKTNQFNLNGRRYSESDWRHFFTDTSSFLLSATYEDKYGELGKIAAILGTRDERSIRVQTWVMSCRAFSRRIEHQCLRYLFDEVGVDEITFDFITTAPNRPMQDFLKAFADSLRTPLTLTDETFRARTPRLFHQIEVGVHV